MQKKVSLTEEQLRTSLEKALEPMKKDLEVIKHRNLMKNDIHYATSRYKEAQLDMVMKSFLSGLEPKCDD
jgi:hypothetical protein